MNEYDDDVKVIYKEGNIIRTINAKLIEENESELVVMRQSRTIRFPWRVVERIEHY